jgi:hypothetical protein
VRNSVAPFISHGKEFGDLNMNQRPFCRNGIFESDLGINFLLELNRNKSHEKKKNFKNTCSSSLLNFFEKLTNSLSFISN